MLNYSDMLKKIVILAVIFLAVAGLRAQVTTEPSPLEEDSKNVVVYFHADEGNKGLAGLPADAAVFAHTGVMVKGKSDWQYAPKWLDNSEKYKLSYVSENLWKLNIGDIRTFYGIKNPDEIVTSLAFVFRNADGSREGKGAGNSDIFVPVGLVPSQEKAYPVGDPVMGPVKNADGSVTFCLGAPGKTSVSLVGEWNGYASGEESLMYYVEKDGMRYFWLTVEGLENDRYYGYYFLVDGAESVGDPYARLVLDPDNDRYIPESVFPDLPAYPDDKVKGVALALYKGDINDYDWRIKSFKGVDKSDLIIYELLVRDFTGSEGKSNAEGTIRKALEKLPYLKELGVNAIELLPINEFGGNNSWGYNPNFYFAPDKAYGTPDDYKEFIDACHENGMAVILDMVFNQSDSQHPWYRMYPPGGNPFFNETAPHAYSVLNDWNQGFQMVQQQWHDVLRYWLTEYKVDGFRFDLVKGLGNNNSYANAGDAATNAFNSSRIARMKELQEVVVSVNPDAYFINEDLAGAEEENEMGRAGQLNWANFNHAGCQYAMGYQEDSGLNGFYAPKNGDRLWGSTVSYLESHDEQRLAYSQNEYGVQGIKGNLENSMHRLGSAAAQMILAPGAHLIWQFSELGNYDNTKNSDGGNNVDPKPVRWNLLKNAQRKGLYDNYSELIGIRNSNPELFSRDAEFENSCGQNNWTSGRTLVAVSGDKELYAVVNPNIDKEITVTVNFRKGENDAYKILSCSYGTAPSYNASAKTVTVPANCYAVVGSAGLTADVVETSSDATDSLRIYATSGGAVIDNADDVVDIYCADGRLAARGRSGERIALPAGFYVAKCGKSTVRILVK